MANEIQKANPTYMVGDLAMPNTHMPQMKVRGNLCYMTHLCVQK